MRSTQHQVKSEIPGVYIIQTKNEYVTLNIIDFSFYTHLCVWKKIP